MGAASRSAVADHLVGLWGRWWPMPVGALAAYALAVYAFGDFRPEHVVIPVVALALAYSTRASKRFFVDVLPYLLVGIGYDSVRYLRPLVVSAPDVLGCGLRDFELSLFRAGPDTTFSDYFAAHHHPVLDVLFAVPYAIFAYLAIVYAGYLFFVDRPRMRHFLWAFMMANFVSFAMWLIVPAAPPWYIRAHGCAIHLDAAPSPGAALLRVDHLFHVGYFQSWYSRTTSVFGAMPSMHCAYPMLGLLTAWRSVTWRTRPLHVLYAVWMFSAAIYLDHHWVLDALAGWLISLVAVLVTGYLLDRWPERVEAGAAEAGNPQEA